MAKELKVEYETKETNDSVKATVVPLIQNKLVAENALNQYLRGVMDTLGLTGNWTFSYDTLSFVRPKEDKCQDTEKSRLTEALPTSKT